jgi:hypothetical protein
VRLFQVDALLGSSFLETQIRRVAHRHRDPMFKAL